MCTILRLTSRACRWYHYASGIAGTAAANRSGLQMDTLRNLLLAGLTLPSASLLGAASLLLV